MPLTLIRIFNLRNLQSLEIKPCEGVNVLWGGNGAGKTSVLEAIYLLSRGKSFRGAEVGPMVTTGHDEMVVYGEIEQTGKQIGTVGIKKRLKGATQIKINHENVKKLSILAKNIPLQILTPKTHEILERGSGYRRKFMDWGVFHVEHDFIRISNRYHRALKQRNAALRKSPKSAFAWDKELVENGEKLEDKRRNYISKLTPFFEHGINVLMERKDITIKYKRGWSDSQTYSENIEARKKDDINRGYTGTGPHRADIEIDVLGYKADKVISRGEQKLVIAALYLAQAKVAAAENGFGPVLLIDDLPAELDKERRKLFLTELEQIGLQVFVTGIEGDYFSSLKNPTMFHVKHGQVVGS